ncbi:MAG TPA: hypothetical protein VF525_00005, partial [Pyrinomonadaceae bacterium]
VRTLAHTQQVEIIYCCRAAGAAAPQSDEIEEVAWFAPDALPAALPPDQHRLIARALRTSANPPD